MTKKKKKRVRLHFHGAKAQRLLHSHWTVPPNFIAVTLREPMATSADVILILSYIKKCFPPHRIHLSNRSYVTSPKASRTMKRTF